MFNETFLDVVITFAFLSACFSLYKVPHKDHVAPGASLAIESPWLWIAGAWALLVYPIAWAHFAYLWPHVNALFESGDRRGYFGFWGGVAFFEWIGLALCLLAMRVSGWSPKAIGLDLKGNRSMVIVFISLIVFFAFWVGVDPMGLVADTPENVSRFAALQTQVIIPVSKSERWMWFGICITAGICEEIMYRGILFAVLQRVTGHLWVAAATSAFAFTYMHGGFHQGYFGFMSRMAFAVLFTTIARSRFGLTAAMPAHFVADALILFR